jgi:hypothetical protein
MRTIKVTESEYEAVRVFSIMSTRSYRQSIKLILKLFRIIVFLRKEGRDPGYIQIVDFDGNILSTVNVFKKLEE